MKLPKELVIGDSIWTVKSVRKIQFNERKRETIGLNDPSTQEILIKTGMSPKERLTTLIHEIIHAFEDEYDVEIGHEIIEKIEDGVAQFFIDNFLGEI